MCVMFMIRNAKGLYWNGCRDTFTDCSHAFCFDSRFQAYEYIRENEDAFGTDRLIVEEVVCLAGEEVF